MGVSGWPAAEASNVGVAKALSSLRPSARGAVRGESIGGDVTDAWADAWAEAAAAAPPFASATVAAASTAEPLSGAPVGGWSITSRSSEIGSGSAAPDGPPALESSQWMANRSRWTEASGRGGAEPPDSAAADAVDAADAADAAAVDAAAEVLLAAGVWVVLPGRGVAATRLLAGARGVELASTVADGTAVTLASISAAQTGEARREHGPCCSAWSANAARRKAAPPVAVADAGSVRADIVVTAVGPEVGVVVEEGRPRAAAQAAQCASASAAPPARPIPPPAHAVQAGCVELGEEAAAAAADVAEVAPPPSKLSTIVAVEAMAAPAVTL